MNKAQKYEQNTSHDQKHKMTDYEHSRQMADTGRPVAAVWLAE
jgi:hypothetical protein